MQDLTLKLTQLNHTGWILRLKSFGFISQHCASYHLLEPPDVLSGPASPVQVHEILAGIGHVVHLQVGCSSKNPRDNAWRQGEAGSVHEVEQKGDAGRVQGVGERHSRELLPAATTPLEQNTVGVQRVEEPTVGREKKKEMFWVRNTIDLGMNLNKFQCF